MEQRRYYRNDRSVAISTNSWEEHRLLTQGTLIVPPDTSINPHCSPHFRRYIDETSLQSRHSDWLQTLNLLQLELYHQIAY